MLCIPLDILRVFDLIRHEPRMACFKHLSHQRKEDMLGVYVKRVSLSFASAEESIILESQHKKYEIAHRILQGCSNIHAVCHPQESF